MLEIDGYRMVVASKYDNSYLYLSPLTSLNVDSKWEFYCKKLENFSERKNSNPNMIYSENSIILIVKIMKCYMTFL